jgi:hypothetical protein
MSVINTNLKRGFWCFDNQLEALLFFFYQQFPSCQLVSHHVGKTILFVNQHSGPYPMSAGK